MHEMNIKNAFSSFEGVIRHPNSGYPNAKIMRIFTIPTQVRQQLVVELSIHIYISSFYHIYSIQQSPS